MFVTIEGPDGSGKSTLSCRLRSGLRDRGLSVKLTEEPTDSKVGSYLQERNKEKPLDPRETALLYAADRRTHSQEVIEPSLEEYDVVISDRYLHSSLAYQGEEDKRGEWVREINKHARDPDFTFFIHCLWETSLDRINDREDQERDIYECEDFLKRMHSRWKTVYQQAKEVGDPHRKFFNEKGTDLDYLQEKMIATLGDEFDI